MTKLRAFTLHLTVSAALILAFMGVMFFVWYPAPYFNINGGWTVLRILVGVDVVLGPLLTLIVFKPGKPSLKFDLSCIALLQLAALIYGGTIIYQQRPEFVIFGTDGFTAVTAAEVEFDQLQYPELQRVAGIGPLLAQTHLPKDPKLWQELILGILLKGERDLEFRAELYEPYRPDLAQLRSHSIDINQISTLSTDAQQAIAAFLTKQGGHLEDYFYLPLRGRYQDIVMVLSAQNGMPVGSIAISPWIKDYQKPTAGST